MKFLFVCTHQIQNLIPLFVELNKKKEIDFKVLYWDKIKKIRIFTTKIPTTSRWKIQVKFRNSLAV